MFLERWDMVKGNSTLPVFISAHSTREKIAEVLSIGAEGIVVGSAVTQAADPAQEASHFAALIGRKSN